ncbi:MAG: hypothetical protein CSA38_01665 [Flavobacteriales bacterium]|nr:MAG: hypothetical protein CSA38_01665 [Flavobacteriales bacterium]
MKLGSPMSDWEFFARLSPTIITMILLAYKEKFTGKPFFLYKKYKKHIKTAPPAYQPISREDYPNVSEEEKQGYLSLLKCCCSAEYQAELSPYFHTLKDYQDDEEYYTTLNFVMEYLEDNDYFFINRIDWKSDTANLAWQIEETLKKHYSEIRIDFPKYDEDTSISEDNVFENFDACLRKHHLQLGFMDTESDEYVFIIHQISDRDKVEQFVNMIGYPYFERGETGKNKTSDEMDEVIEYIKQEVAFGFDNQEQILESVWNAGFENEDQLDEKWIKTVIAKFYNEHYKASLQWEKPTDVDQLAQVFDELNQEKIIALHKAGYTKQDGYDDVMEVVEQLKAKNESSPKGFCFYHMQDLERAIDPKCKNLFLAFDDLNQNTEQGILIGKRIVEKLKDKGFAVEWNETIEQRIEIKNISWKKMPSEESWGIDRAIQNFGKANNKTDYPPQDVLTDVFWNFSNPQYSDVNSFSKALLDYNHKMQPKNELDIDRVFNASQKIEVQYTYWREDKNGEEEQIEESFIVTTENKNGFTVKEFLFKIHHTICKNMLEEEATFFEGLTPYNKHSDIPFFFINQGS